MLASTVTDVLVDLQGAFVPTGGLQLSPLTPSRIADTRITGRADPLVLTAPPGAKGVVLNVTGVGSAVPGFLVVYPCDQPIPSTSNLNFVAGAAVGRVGVRRSGGGGHGVRARQHADRHGRRPARDVLCRLVR